MGGLRQWASCLLKWGELSIKCCSYTHIHVSCCTYIYSIPFHSFQPVPMHVQDRQNSGVNKLTFASVY